MMAYTTNFLSEYDMGRKTTILMDPDLPSQGAITTRKNKVLFCIFSGSICALNQLIIVFLPNLFGSRIILQTLGRWDNQPCFGSRNDTPRLSSKLNIQ